MLINKRNKEMWYTVYAPLRLTGARCCGVHRGAGAGTVSSCSRRPRIVKPLWCLFPPWQPPPAAAAAGPGPLRLLIPLTTPLTQQQAHGRLGQQLQGSTLGGGHTGLLPSHTHTHCTHTTPHHTQHSAYGRVGRRRMHTAMCAHTPPRVHTPHCVTLPTAAKLVQHTTAWP